MTKTNLTPAELVLASKEEADLVLEAMNKILGQLKVVLFADFYALVGFPSTHEDTLWGWKSLDEVNIRQIEQGFMIDFPTAEIVRNAH